MPEGRLGLEREVREDEIPGGKVDMSINVHAVLWLFFPGKTTIELGQELGQRLPQV